ncbi:MAG: aminoacyl-tRNA deacylase [Spirochaetota bacterium]
MLSRKLIHLLKEKHIHYGIRKHPRAYTAQTTAESAHISGRMVAKTVILRVEGDLRMFVMPAGEVIDMDALRDIFGTDDIRLAREDEYEGVFDDCELGGEPPFGNLYGMPVYVSPRLAVDEEIAFNAGDHARMLKMRFADYDNLVHPCILNWH